MKHKLAERHPFEGKYFTMPSMTIPDQTMSIRTILEKYARGENFNQKIPIFSDEDNTGLDIRKLDLSEIHEIAKQNNQEIKRMQDELANAKTKKEKDEIERLIQSRAKQLMEQNNGGSEKASDSTQPI